MKSSMRSIISILMAMLFVFAAVFCIAACTPAPDDPGGNKPAPLKPYGDFTEADFIKADGTLLKNYYGTGDPVLLRGTNAGGYLLLECWMTAFNAKSAVDHKTTSGIFAERFGKQGALDLWEYYRSMYWQESDFKNCADMGMNVIRLPFSYMNVDPEFDNIEAIPGEKYNFRLLDNFIAMAAKYGIYTMLDLHGAYGSQSGKDHSGEVVSVEKVDFYSNEEKMGKTAALWKAIAERYVDNPAVCGYDILNEPGENAGTTSKRHWDFFDRVYKAIREVDTEHVIIIESCWTGSDLPKVSVYGWENVMYSFHHYTNAGNNYSTHIASMKSRVSEVNNKKFGIPILMGEFTNYTNEQSWDETLKLLTDNGWHWTTWTYKVNSNNSSWGIYNTHASDINPTRDSIADIKKAWLDIATSSTATTKTSFESGRSEYDIMQQAFAQEYIPAI